MHFSSRQCFGSIFTFPAWEVKSILILDFRFWILDWPFGRIGFVQRSVQNLKSKIQNRTMLLYVLIGLCLSLAGVAGLQLMYMFYLDRLDRHRKRHVHQLEAECRRLTNLLAEAERELKIKTELISVAYPEFEDEEAWADVIEDR